MSYETEYYQRRPEIRIGYDHQELRKADRFEKDAVSFSFSSPERACALRKIACDIRRDAKIVYVF